MNLLDIEKMVKTLYDNWFVLFVAGFVLYHGVRILKTSYDGFKSFVGDEVEARLGRAFSAHEAREGGIVKEALREHVEMYHPRRAVPRRARR